MMHRLSIREPLRDPNFLCMFLLRNTSRPRVKICALTPSPVVYATDRSKAVVLMLFLFCVAIWLLLLSCLALCFPVVVFFFFFFFFFSAILRVAFLAWGRELAGLCASRASVCLFCTR